MNHRLGDLLLRRPEPRDLESLYRQKNDPLIARLLGGFSNGYAMADMQEWLENHRRNTNEVLWAIVDTASEGTCVGHVGLYNIDRRIRMAEYAIMLGLPSSWGKGWGTVCTRFALGYGFDSLNLNRVYLHVLADNERAIRLYGSLGFVEEGRLRQAQYKDGQYIDVVVMSVLQAEYEKNVGER